MIISVICSITISVDYYLHKTVNYVLKFKIICVRDYVIISTKAIIYLFSLIYLHKNFHKSTPVTFNNKSRLVRI